MVRLITQNLLSCPSRACAYPANFPLSFRNVERIEMTDAEFNEEFLRGVLSRLEWAALRKSAAELGNTDLPEQSPDLTQPDAISLDLLKTLHHVLLEIVVAEGEMVCPQCEHVFRIKDTIPNMLLAEHEIRKLNLVARPPAHAELACCAQWFQLQLHLRLLSRPSSLPSPPRAAKLAHKRVLTNHRRKPSGDGSSGGLASTLPSFRLKIRHLLFALALFSLSLFYFTGGNSTGSARRQSAAQRSLAELTVHCPFSTSRKHIPTVILHGTQAHDRHANRTVSVVDQPGDVPAPFLPYSYPPRDLRIAQTISPQNEALNHKEHHRPGMGRLHEGVHPDDESGSQLCKVYRVPSSPRPRLAGAFAHHKVMYGMSTTADRVLWNLPVWAQWLPGVPKPPLDPDDKGAVARLPLVLVLTPPTTASDSNRHRDAIEATERLRAREAEEEAAIHGMHIALRPRAAERFETRYFALAEEMWREAKTREEKEGVHTEWFVFADDDTFFPDVDALGRMLGSLDSHDDHLIGALSESTKQVNQWGHIAYGGAGIIVSRGLLAKMNQDGVWEHCLAKFGAAFGGDAMVSHCAALAMDMSVERALTIEPTMHQLDIRGDGTGFFQSGFLFTSIHHWGSWYTLFPPWTDAGVGDLRKGIVLVGKAAQAVGGDNWGRRYVFEDGKVIVALGYSITVEATPLTFDELNKSEHTWWEFETFHPIRPGQEEAVDKRTYYLSNVRQLDAAGIFRLEHKNREGERIDIIWDQRGPGGTNRWLAEKR